MAGSSGAIRAGKAYIELFVDDGKVSPGLQRTMAKMAAFAGGAAAVMKAVAATTVVAGGALLALGVNAANAGSAIHDLATRTGMTAEAASGLKYAAEQSATSIEAVERGVVAMQKTLVNTPEAFAAVGLSVEDLKKLAPDQQLMKIADAIAAIDDPAEQTAAAMRIFGKAGAELIPLLEEGSSGIKKMTDKARELGLVMSTDDAAAAAEFGDKLDEVKAEAGALLVKLGTDLMPILKEFVVAIQPILKAFDDWIIKTGVLRDMLRGLGEISADTLDYFDIKRMPRSHEPLGAGQGGGKGGEISEANFAAMQKERAAAAGADQAAQTREFWAARDREDLRAAAEKPEFWDFAKPFMGSKDEEGWGSWGGVGDLIGEKFDAIADVATDYATNVATGIQDAMQNQTTSSVLGTFSGATAAQSLNLNTTDQKIEQNTKDTAKAVEDLFDWFTTNFTLPVIG